MNDQTKMAELTNQPIQMVPAAEATPMTMLATAVDRGMDLETIKGLMDLKREWDADEARKAFGEAMANFKRDVPTLIKNKKVGYKTKEGDFVGYSHVGLDQACEVLGPALAVHGLKHSWSIDQGEKGIIRVTCFLSHQLGHSESVSLSANPDSSGKKNGIQQIASTVTYLERYTFLAITGTAAKDQDDDGAASGGQPEPAALPQTYPADKFERLLPSWKALIESGEKTSAAVINKVTSKGQLLTEDQINQINAVKAPITEVSP